MKEHMLKSIPVGTFIGLILSLISTVISYYLIIL